MFSGIPEPLVYAEKLIGQFANVLNASEHEALLNALAQAATLLTECELVQVYIVEPALTRLDLAIECLNGTLQSQRSTGLHMDCSGEQLLQFALSHNRTVCLGDVSTSLHEAGFLPPRATAWKALLCVPLVVQGQSVRGVLVCASGHDTSLQGFAESISQLGSLALGRLQLMQRQQNGSARKLAPAIKIDENRYGLIGDSAAMRHVYSLIGKVANSPYTVLLQGETGTGKELVARAIHDCGARRAKVFVVQNCATFPEQLLESELFGYRKGAFTGADRDREGLFQAADGGTLLLDEIGDMPLSLQAKLLRVLQDGEIRPLGSNTVRKVDVRIIAATHRDLMALVREGSFRADLYYRLAQFPIEMPPLRHRESDVLHLARHFADQACVFLERMPVSWPHNVLHHLSRYSFPGNVRELKGAVERAVLLCDGEQLEIGHFSLGPVDVQDDKNITLREQLEIIERDLLIRCLSKNGGNKTVTARELGLPRRTFLYRLDRLNINKAAFSD